jgi:hypothetical protein
MTVRESTLIVFSLLLSSTGLSRSAPGVRWGRQIVTPTTDSIFATLVADSNEGVYLSVTRKSEDDAGQKSEARYLLKYSQDGAPLWSKQLGVNEEGNSVPLMVNDMVITAFCRRYTPDGKLAWVKVFRKKSRIGGTCGRAVAIDSNNNCYLAGGTKADNFAVNNGTSNIFLIRLE